MLIYIICLKLISEIDVFFCMSIKNKNKKNGKSVKSMNKVSAGLKKFPDMFLRCMQLSDAYVKLQENFIYIPFLNSHHICNYLLKLQNSQFNIFIF
jgi:hypothetical protein